MKKNTPITILPLPIFFNTPPFLPPSVTSSTSFQSLPIHYLLNVFLSLSSLQLFVLSPYLTLFLSLLNPCPFLTSPSHHFVNIQSFYPSTVHPLPSSLISLFSPTSIVYFSLFLSFIPFLQQIFILSPLFFILFSSFIYLICLSSSFFISFSPSSTSSFSPLLSFPSFTL